jgi:hypothetical protein
MWTRITSQQFSKKTIPWIFVSVAILAYGLLTPWMGFYWDDWVFVWLLKHHGSVELARSFLPFDPLVSPFFLITSSIFGTNAFAWQIFALVVRILVSLAALWTFNQIWPQYSRKVIWAAFFFLVYPGYAQQWVAFTHSNQEWISLGFFILSLGLTAKSLRENLSKKWLLFALIAQFIGSATTEYFLGMEFLRPIIIWIVISQPGDTLRKRVIDTSRYWGIGYLPVWLFAGIGQYLFHRSPYYGGHSFGVDLSERGIPTLISSLLRDIVPTLRVSAFDAWTQTFNLITSSLSSLTDWLTLGLIILSFIGLAFYFRHLQSTNLENRGDSWAAQAIILGLVGIIGGRLPSWLAGLPIVLRFDWDRLFISMLFGTSLLTAGLIDYLVKEGYRKELFISLLIALAIGMQFQQANTFRRDWQNQKNFFWQLDWRAPALKPDTVLLTDQLPLQYVADLQLSAPLNLMYTPDGSSFSYMLLYVKNRLGGSMLPKLAPNLPIDGGYRTVKFQSTTSNIAVIYQPSDGCLQVLDPRYVSSNTFSDLSPNLNNNLDLSNVSQIEKNPNGADPKQFFGQEPAHTWCYYFEKAAFAQQFGDWKEVIHNYELATSAGYTSMLPSENLVFIEAFARSGNTKKADLLTNTVIKQDAKLCKALVSTWQRALQASPAISAEAQIQINALNDLPECK